MLGKKAKPVIGILTGSLLSGNRSGTAGIATRTHFESNPQSVRKFDLGAVGLGIVASLEKSGEVRAEFPALFSRNMTRSNPIPLPINNMGASMEIESLDEEYTVVTRHGQNQSYTRVYGDDSTSFRIQNNNINSKRSSVFKISPVEVGGGAPPPDFLSSCSMCQKKLHGKDIYMYRGEKAFCSTECRDRQIVMDEHKEKCMKSKASKRRVDVSSSHCADNGKIFTIGIMAI